MGRDRSDTQSDGAPSLLLHPAVFHPNRRSFTAHDSVCVCRCVFRGLPSLQVGPSQASVHRHRPVCRSQGAPWEHWHSREQPGPKRPSGHSGSEDGEEMSLDPAPDGVQHLRGTPTFLTPLSRPTRGTQAPPGRWVTLGLTCTVT